MVAKVMHGVDEGVESVQLFECDSVNFWRTDESWNVQLIKANAEVAAFHEDAESSKVCIYLMENGQTVDRLPRR